MKKIAIGICLGSIAIAAVALGLWWHHQRRAAAADLLQADEAIRALDEQAAVRYSGSDPATLAALDAIAREKMKALDALHLTADENFCAVDLGFKLETAEAGAQTAVEIFRYDLLTNAKPDLSPQPNAAKAVTDCVRELQ
jgi:hypothetical protein